MAGPNDADFFARLAQANEAFRAGLPSTLNRLRAAAADFDPAAPTPHLVAELQSLLHTLAGAGVTFGMRQLGQGARELEQRLRVLTAFTSVGADDWSAWVEDVAGFAETFAAGAPGATPACQPAAASQLLSVNNVASSRLM